MDWCRRRRRIPLTQPLVFTQHYRYANNSLFTLQLPCLILTQAEEGLPTVWCSSYAAREHSNGTDSTCTLSCWCHQAERRLTTVPGKHRQEIWLFLPILAPMTPAGQPNNLPNKNSFSFKIRVYANPDPSDLMRNNVRACRVAQHKLNTCSVTARWCHLVA